MSMSLSACVPVDVASVYLAHVCVSCFSVCVSVSVCVFVFVCCVHNVRERVCICCMHDEYLPARARANVYVLFMSNVLHVLCDCVLVSMRIGMCVLSCFHCLRVSLQIAIPIV